jgi:hypothetical protein
MFEIDGKELDLTQPLVNITIKEGGYIEQSKDGRVVRVTKEDLDKEANARIAALEVR